MDTPDLNPLACTGCRKRKIRCNRSIPSCSRCIDNKLSCDYPRRVQRCIGIKNQHFTDEQVLSKEGTSTKLNLVPGGSVEVERAYRDFHSTVLPFDFTLNTAQTSIPRGFSTPRGIASASAVFDQQPLHGFGNTSELTVESPYLNISLYKQPNGIHTSVIMLLETSLDHVQTLRGQRMSHMVTQSDSTLPSTITKPWLETFLEKQPVDMFLGFVDMKLMRMVPDLISMPDVTLKPVIHVLYYLILHYGSAFPSHYTTQYQSDETDYPTTAYIGALRSLSAWQEEATGSNLDFAAAILMAFTASEHFDMETTWKMFHVASQYADKLQLHNIDAHHAQIKDAANACDVATDDKRKSFWDLIGKDLFCRLVSDRPPIINAHVDLWRVDLPWLHESYSSTHPYTKPDHLTMIFLVRSRLTMTLIRFFQIGESDLSAQRAMGSVYDICLELLVAFDEWPISELLKANTHMEGVWWKLCEICLDVYCGITMMLHRVSELDSSSSTDCPVYRSDQEQASYQSLLVTVSRRLLALINDFLALFPGLPTVSLVFGLYRCHISIGYLAQSIICHPGIQQAKDDIALLTRISTGVSCAAKGHNDLRPFVLSLEEILYSLQYYDNK